MLHLNEHARSNTCVPHMHTPHGPGARGVLVLMVWKYRTRVYAADHHDREHEHEDACGLGRACLHFSPNLIGLGAGKAHPYMKASTSYCLDRRARAVEMPLLYFISCFCRFLVVEADMKGIYKHSVSATSAIHASRQSHANIF